MAFAKRTGYPGSGGMRLRYQRPGRQVLCHRNNQDHKGAAGQRKGDAGRSRNHGKVDEINYGANWCTL